MQAGEWLELCTWGLQQKKGSREIPLLPAGCRIFPPGLGNLLQLSEADAGPCDCPWCEAPHGAPKYKPHPQTNLGAVLLLRELWAALFPLFRQNPCSHLGFLESPEGACQAGQSQSPEVPSQCQSDLEMPVHWESQLFLGCHPW